jgi:ABC-type multidrug transport system fused ATPase/permease subunit
VFNTKF